MAENIIPIPMDAWTPPNSTIFFTGQPGPCTAAIETNQNVLVPWVYQTGYFQWTYSGAGADLVSPDAATEVELFTSALGQTVPGAWFTQAADDTNLPSGEEGAPVCRGLIYYARGMAVQVRFPFLRGAGGAATDDQYESAWLGKNGTNGPAYGARIQRAALNNVSISVSHNNPTVELPLGVALNYSGYADVEGGDNVRNGSISNVEYVPFSNAISFGAKDDCRKLKITLKWGKQVTIQNDTSQGTLAGPNGNVLYVGVRVILFGQTCRRPADTQCLIVAAPTVSTPAARPW